MRCTGLAHPRVDAKAKAGDALFRALIPDDLLRLAFIVVGYRCKAGMLESDVVFVRGHAPLNASAKAGRDGLEVTNKLPPYSANEWRHIVLCSRNAWIYFGSPQHSVLR